MKIGKDDAAIIFKADGSTELALPKQGPEEKSPPNSILACAILAMLKDRECPLREMIYEKIDGWIKDNPTAHDGQGG